ncbi:MAG: hypothetical protein ACXAD7_00375 [Candidatus Kariarchaeaceae archaeon]
MKLTKLYFGIGLAVLLLSSIAVSPVHSMANYKKTTGKVTLETDTLAVEITGGANIPSYFFWKIGENTTTYKIQFSQVFEAIDNNTNGNFDLQEDKKVQETLVSLGSMNWDFSEFDVVTDENDVTQEVHFNITAADEQKGQGNSKTLVIQLRNHLYTGEDAELKFDILIQNYEFSNENAMLVVGFKLITTGNEVMNQYQNRIQFGNGYFETEEIADGNGTQLNVGFSAGEESASKMIFLAYEHFDGNLTHDPTIGVGDVTSSSGDPDGDTTTDVNTDGDGTTDQKSDIGDSIFPDLSKGDLVTTSILASVAFIMVPVVVYFNRTRK